MKNYIIILALICNIFFFFASCSNEKKENSKAINANFKQKVNNIFFTDTIIGISSENYSLKIKSIFVNNIAPSNMNITKHIYRQTIYFYDKNELIDSINFKVLPFTKITNIKFNINILTCSINEISLICGKNDTLYKLYGGGTAKHLEYLSIYSLKGDLIYSCVADWDTTYLLVDDIKKVKDKFQGDIFSLDKQCSTANISLFY